MYSDPFPEPSLIAMNKRNVLLIITGSSIFYSTTLAFGIAANIFHYWPVIAIALIAGGAHGF
jgi:hypothetical protein